MKIGNIKQNTEKLNTFVFSIKRLVQFSEKYKIMQFFIK